MGTESFLGLKSGWSVTLTHPLLVLWSRKSRAIPLLPPRGRRPVQSLTACTTVQYTFYHAETNILSYTIVSCTCKYLLTAWCRVLLEKLTGLQLVKKFPAFHVIRRFITALTSVRHLSLSWASPIQSINPHPTSWRSILL